MLELCFCQVFFLDFPILLLYCDLMPKFIDRTGKTYGYLTVICVADFKRGNKIVWKCSCKCGNIAFVAAGDLWNTKSCGCYRIEELKKNPHFMTHGYTRNRKTSSTYKTWAGMKQRCLNPKSQSYEYYGGRGIKICDKWLEYENFLSDMGERPIDKHVIDRINNNGNYEPGNCRWATNEISLNNTSRNSNITFKNKTLTLTQWSRKIKIPVSTIQNRLKRGWSIEKTLTEPNY